MSALASKEAWSFEDPSQRTIGKTLLAVSSLNILVRLYGRCGDQDLARQEQILFEHMQVAQDEHTKAAVFRKWRDIGRYRKLLKEVGTSLLDS